MTNPVVQIAILAQVADWRQRITRCLVELFVSISASTMPWTDQRRGIPSLQIEEPNLIERQLATTCHLRRSIIRKEITCHIDLRV